VSSLYITQQQQHLHFQFHHFLTYQTFTFCSFRCPLTLLIIRRYLLIIQLSLFFLI
jgi:hypothetical protein